MPFYFVGTKDYNADDGPFYRGCVVSLAQLLELYPNGALIVAFGVTVCHPEKVPYICWMVDSMEETASSGTPKA